MSYCDELAAGAGYNKNVAMTFGLNHPCEWQLRQPMAPAPGCWRIMGFSWHGMPLAARRGAAGRRGLPLAACNAAQQRLFGAILACQTLPLATTTCAGGNEPGRVVQVMKAHMMDRAASFPQCFQPVAPRPSPPPPIPRPPPPPPGPSGNWSDPVALSALPYTSPTISVRPAEGRLNGWLSEGQLRMRSVAAKHGWRAAAAQPASTPRPAAVLSCQRHTKSEQMRDAACPHSYQPVLPNMASALQGWVTSGQLPIFCNDTATPLDASGKRLSPRGVKVFR